jgi:hypothetical protein
MASLLLRSRLAPLDLCAPAAFGQIRGSLLPRLFAWLNVIDDFCRALRPRQAGGNSFVLQYVGIPGESRTAALHVDLEFILADLGIGETLANGFLDLHVGLRRMIAGGARSLPRRDCLRAGFFYSGRRLSGRLRSAHACESSEKSQNGNETTNLHLHSCSIVGREGDFSHQVAHHACRIGD